MFPPHLLDERRVLAGASIRSKKRLLETLAELLASDQPQLNREAVFDRLLERERLGSTGLGHGVALPHARVAEVTDSIGAFIQLREPVSFDAIDDQPVDLAFALLVPEEANEAHLRLLADLAELFNRQALRQQLHGALDARALLAILTPVGLPGASGPDTAGETGANTGGPGSSAAT